MVFSSLIFLYAFLPLSLLVYVLCRGREAKNMSLLVFSLIFYAWGEPKYVLLLMFMSLCSWFCALRVEKADSQGRRKLWVAVSCAIDIALIGFFKYAGLVCSVFGQVPEFVANIALPIGISFYTFQLLTYVVDVYRGDAEAQPSYLNVLLYASLFHQCVAGPIVRYKTIAHELFVERDSRDILPGISRFTVGLAKKTLLANPCGALADQLLLTTDAASNASLFSENLASLSGLSALGAWVGVAAFMMQIYLDFSAYSDMAIGMGRMLGLHYLENFDYPYLSKTVTEFWRRWHISLSTWLKDYLYISLGGNRKGRFRTYVNLVVTMLLGGLWHGAAPRFVLWGGFHGLLLALHKFLMRLFPRMKATGADMKRGWRIAGIFVTFHLVCLGWIFFRARDVGTGADILEQVFTNFDISLIPNIITGYWEIFAMMLVGYVAHFTPRRLQERACDAVIRNPLAVNALLIVVIIWVVMQVKSADIQPFIYFQF